MHMKTIYIFPVLSVLLWQCQYRKEPVQPLTCTEGYEVIAEQCQCPPTKKEAYGVCRALGQFGYYGVASDCYCPDTMLLNLTERKYDPFTQTESIKVQLINPDWTIPGAEMKESRVAYFPHAEGDSLEGEFGYRACYIGNQPCLRYLYGKMIGPDTLRLKIVYRSRHIQEDMAIPVDSCLVYLHK